MSTSKRTRTHKAGGKEEQVHAVPRAPDRPPERTLFTHIPKTGGTTLDSILSSHYPAATTTRLVQHSATNSVYEGIFAKSNLYVSGHIPFSGVSHLNFDRMITILREPHDILCSLLSYSEEIGYANNELDVAKPGADPFQIYGVYFSPNFDFGRYMIDRQYGVASGYQPYFTDGAVDEALAMLSTFDYVLDFENLDLQIKRLISCEGLFPPSEIAKRRSYKYSKNEQAANARLSQFDVAFFRAARRFFSSNYSESDYETYRAQYCDFSGIRLSPNESQEVDLSSPIGSGWNDAEISELGRMFRWSESNNPFIDLPLANPGTYAVYLYLNNVHHRGIAVHGSGQLHRPQVEADQVCHGALNIFRFRFRISRPDWFCCALSITTSAEQTANGATDDRSLGLILGSIYVRRVS
jgi:hypothetical protein